MSAWTNGNYTKKGLSLLTKLMQGSSLKITRAVTGTGYVSPSAIADQTGVSGIKQTLLFKATSYPEPGVCKLPMFITNENLETGYKARQIGLYALDPDEGEILYFLAQSEAGTDVPSKTDMPEYSSTWTFYFRYGQADDVTVNVDPSHTITEDMLNEVRILAENNVATSEIGNPLVLENTANVPLANLILYGKTTQNGTPSPDNPLSLENVGASGSVNVKAYGKNLLNIHTSGTIAGITETISNGLVSFSGTAEGGGGRTAWMRSDILTLYPGSYHLSMKVPSGNAGMPYLTKVGTSNVVATLGNFTISETTQVYLGFNYEKDVTYNAQNVSVQLEIGYTDTEHESFKPFQTLTLSAPNGLPGIPVSKNGNHRDENGQEWLCDEIDLVRGVRVQRVATETVTFSYDSINKRYSATLKGTMGTAYGTSTSVPVLCNALPYNELAGSGNPIVNGVRGAATSPKYIIAYYNGKELGTVIVSYPLATPIETPLPAAEVSASKYLHSNNPTTTIFNDAGADMLVKCGSTSVDGLFRQQFIRFSANADGTDFTDELGKGQRYIGIATGPFPPSDKSGYKWSLLKVASLEERVFGKEWQAPIEVRNEFEELEQCYADGLKPEKYYFTVDKKVKQLFDLTGMSAGETRCNDLVSDIDLAPYEKSYYLYLTAKMDGNGNISVTASKYYVEFGEAYEDNDAWAHWLGTGWFYAEYYAPSMQDQLTSLDTRVSNLENVGKGSYPDWTEIPVEVFDVDYGHAIPHAQVGEKLLVSYLGATFEVTVEEGFQSESRCLPEDGDSEVYAHVGYTDCYYFGDDYMSTLYIYFMYTNGDNHSAYNQMDLWKPIEVKSA